MTEPPKRRQPRSAWLVVVALGLGFGLFVAFLLGQGSSPRALEAHFAERPDLAATTAAFRESYPGDYAAFLGRIGAVADAEGQAAADRAAIAEIRAFLAARSERIASAPAPDLHALGRAIAELAQALQRTNADLCAQFVARGVLDPARLPPAATRAIGEMNARMFRAARGGEASNAVQRGGLARPDVAAWLARMDALDPNLLAAPANPADTKAQCARGVILYRAAADLPEAQAANVTAHLVRLSFARPPAGR